MFCLHLKIYSTCRQPADVQRTAQAIHASVSAASSVQAVQSAGRVAADSVSDGAGRRAGWRGW